MKKVTVRRRLAIPKVVDRVEAALLLYQRKHPNQVITVSALARLAGVNRSNLYTSHKDLVDRLREQPKPERRANNKSSIQLLQKRVRALSRQNQALLLLNVELSEEICRLRLRLK